MREPSYDELKCWGGRLKSRAPARRRALSLLLVARSFALCMSALLVASCASSGFSVSFSRVRYEGQKWRLELAEPSPTRKVGGVEGWQLQRAAGDRAAWFYGDAFAGWPPTKVLLLLALEDLPAAKGAGPATPEVQARVSWVTAWEKPGFVGRVALEGAADELRWIGEAKRRPVGLAAAPKAEAGAEPAAESAAREKKVRAAQPGEQDVAPFIARFRDAWGGSLTGGFWVRGHILCRRLEHVPIISCAITGLPSSEEPSIGAEDFLADEDMQAVHVWASKLLDGVEARRVTKW